MDIGVPGDVDGIAELNAEWRPELRGGPATKTDVSPCVNLRLNSSLVMVTVGLAVSA